MALEILSERPCFGGVQGSYRVASQECATPMRFSVFRPPQAESRRVPVVYCLAGLECNEETFMIKAGAQRCAAEFGLMLVSPDTSPREARIPGDDESWDFGIGAGFYVDATEAPWSTNYRMYSFVTKELPRLVGGNFPADVEHQGILGHSMGGHGALVCALRNPGVYRSVSAFAPIVAPSQVPWGQKAFTKFFRSNSEAWESFDATELAKTSEFAGEILIDQGLGDKFLRTQLQPEKFVAACEGTRIAPRLREHEGYDHSYWFIQTFIADHLKCHAARLAAAASR